MKTLYEKTKKFEDDATFFPGKEKNELNNKHEEDHQYKTPEQVVKEHPLYSVCWEGDFD